MIFEGSMVAIVTPLKDGQVDEAALRKLVDFHVENGTSAIVPCGTTGESATLSHEEHEQVIQIVVEQSDKKAKVLAGAGSNNTQEALRLHKFCDRVGVDGALHITPYYNKPTQEGLYQHFKVIAESCELPIVLYNVPSRTGVNMAVDTVARLSEIKNIVGIKEASGDLVQASKIIQSVPEEFGLYSGEDSLTFPLYGIGAKGVISVTANLVPQLMAEQYDSVKKENWKRAKEIHYQLLELHDVLFVETNPIPIKAALNMMGLLAEEYRLPLVAMSAENREKVKQVLNKMKLVF